MSEVISESLCLCVSVLNLLLYEVHIGMKICASRPYVIGNLTSYRRRFNTEGARGPDTETQR